jgi:5S rRNA maturation endonuclease (ribonuclease M5)
VKSIIKQVRDEVDPREYYARTFPDTDFSGGPEVRVLSPFSDEKNASLSLNVENGKWYSFSGGDEFGGHTIISFYARLNDVSKREAAEEIFADFLHPVISMKKVRRWRKAALGTPSVLKYLRSRRVSEKTAERMRLGWNGERITFPVVNEHGLCVNAKLYDPLRKPKMLNYKVESEPRSFGSPPTLYPLSAFEAAEKLGWIVVCEGEWDALALLSLKIPAVTSTAGAKSWPKQYNELFAGLRVIIIYDNDEDGVKYARKRVLKNLLNVARSVSQVHVPKKAGKDVTDWMKSDKRMRRRRRWLVVIEKAELLAENLGEERDGEVQRTQVPLAEASRAEWFDKPIAVDCLVNGKDTAPYLIPKKFRVLCSETCDPCPLAERDYLEGEIDPTNVEALSLLDCTDATKRRTLFGMVGVPTRRANCRGKLVVMETANVERVLVIPTLETSTGQYVARAAYFAGHGLVANRSYRLEGVTTPHPKTQQVTHLFARARPIKGEMDTFELTKRLKKRLCRFRPGGFKPLAHLMRIADWQSRHVTKIKERPDLHILVDLAFHSVRGFDFNGERVDRGMLDVLVLGDTRCGKGYVTERLAKHYGAGEVASGENCSFAGLVGGAQQIGNRWMITWGVIPLNHDRLVIIDEASALTEAELGHMSRVRSEGVAEISKIVKERTRASARLVWLSNPRSGRPLASYNTGVEAIKELIGNNEDLSRFDLALTVATEEVPSEIINSVLDYSLDDADLYPSELCHALIMWCWSRRPEDVHFSPKATKLVIKRAIELGRRYSPIIPLVQGENIRVKIAKIAAAVAARCFSSDETGEQVLVKAKHVSCACAIMRMAYDKPSMSYDMYSKSGRAIATIESPRGALDQLGSNRERAVEGLFELYQITPDSLADFVGDAQTAKLLIGELVKLRCLIRIEKGRWYLKNGAFSAWLRAERRKR